MCPHLKKGIVFSSGDDASDRDSSSYEDITCFEEWDDISYV